MLIIDMHAHVYPEKIAARAKESINKFYGLEMNGGSGVVKDLKAQAEKAGVKKIVVHSVSTTPKQVISINDFVSGEAKKDPALMPFATLHPDMAAAEISAEVKRIKELGMLGIKLHPDFQAFPVDGEKAYAIFSALDGSIPVQLHAGDPRLSYSHPKMIARVAKDFPHIRFIAAHFGGWEEWDDAYVYLDTPNVFFDTSSALAFMTPERAVGLIDMLGEDRFMFATDYPMWNYEGELKRIEKLNLPKTALEKIMGGNAVNFMKLKIEN
jgi:Predicted metal-dependent hydrolase of the TIM-barrel fold